MKRILSMLLVLCMIVSMLPLAVFAAETEVEVANGKYTAEADAKTFVPNWSGYTPYVDGTLTVIIGENDVNWSADVYYIGGEPLGATSGTGAGTFTADISAGTTYRVRVWETNGGSLEDLPVTVIFTSEEEDHGIVVEGDVLNDVENAPMKAMDAAVSNNANGDVVSIYHEFNVAKDGIVTVHILDAKNASGDACEWYFSGSMCGQVTGKGEAAREFEVRAGSVCSFEVAPYIDYAAAAGTVSYEVLFYEEELAAVQEKFMFAETIEVGGEAVAEIVPDAEAPVTATVTMMENADATVVGITPDEVGVYTITVGEGATIADLKTNATLIDLFVDSAEYGDTIVWTCKEVASEETLNIQDENGNWVEHTQKKEGQTLYVGIKSGAGNAEITVEKTGDYEVVEVELQTYVNKAELSQFVLPEDATLGAYVNVSDSVDHEAVLGTDGYYHLDSADGPILLVDMDYADIVLTNALTDGRGIMYAFVVNENGETVEKWDIANACKAYEAVCDGNGYYPLTEDLIFFYQTYGVGNWVYSTVLDTSMMQDADVWMYCMRTMTLPGAEGDAATSGTLSVPSYESVDWTAPASGTVNFTVTPAESTVPVFLYGELAPLLLITNGTGSMEVTEGVVYEFMDADGVSPTIEWAYEAGEEPEVPSEADGSYMNPYIYETMDALMADWQGRAMSIGQEVYIVAPLCGYTVTLSDNFDGAVCFVHSKTGMYLESPYTFDGEKGDVIMIGLYNRGRANQLTISAAEAGSGSVEQGDGTVNNPYTYASIEDMVAAWTSRAVAGETTVYIQAPVAGLTVSVKDNYGAACFEDRFGMEIMNSITFDAFAVNPVVFALKNRAPFETNVTLSVGGAQGGEVTYTDLILNDDMSVEGQDCHWTFTAPDPGVLTLTTGGAIMGPVAFTYSINGDDPVSLDLSTTVEIDMWTGDIIKIDVIASGHSSLTTAWSGEAVEEDPNALVLGENIVSVEAEDADGETWTFTAPEAGDLTIAVTSLTQYINTEEGIVEEALGGMGLNMAFGMGSFNLYINGQQIWDVANTVTVAAGDEVTVQIYAGLFNLSNAFTASISLTLEASSGGEGGEVGESGTVDNPIVITVADLPLTIEEAEPHDLYYSLTVDEACKLKVTHTENGLVAWGDFAYDKDDDNSWYTVSLEAGQTVVINPFSYTGGATYVISLDDSGDSEEPGEPDGSYNNPYILENLYGTLEVQMPEACTVYYKYTATADGCVAANDPTYALTAYFGENYTMGAYSFKAGDAVLINFDGMPGTYTVELYDPAVAKIGNVTYTSLGEALTAAMPGDVVTLLADVDAYGYLVLPVGVSVDLGEHTLSADYIYGSKESSIIGIPQKSQLNVPKGNLILGQAATNNLGQYVLPIWDEANNCYQMSLFVVNTNKSDRGLFIDEANETIRFQFKVQATTAFFETLMRDNGLTDNDMSVIIRLQWKTYNKDGEELGIAYQNFVYNDTQVSMSTGNYDLSFTLTGFSALNISLDDLVVVALVETASGADAYGTEWNVNNAK